MNIYWRINLILTCWNIDGMIFFFSFFFFFACFYFSFALYFWLYIFIFHQQYTRHSRHHLLHFIFSLLLFRSCYWVCSWMDLICFVLRAVSLHAEATAPSASFISSTSLGLFNSFCHFYLWFSFKLELV